MFLSCYRHPHKGIFAIDVCFIQNYQKQFFLNTKNLFFMKHSFLLRLIVAISITVVTLSCSKDAPLVQPPISTDPTPQNTSDTINVPLSTWEEVSPDVYINYFPGFFSHISLTGKKILIYATVDYASYTFQALINERPAPYEKGQIWAITSGPDLTLYLHLYPYASLPSFANLKIQVVVQ
jgi:hypothetical protein